MKGYRSPPSHDRAGTRTGRAKHGRCRRYEASWPIPRYLGHHVSGRTKKADILLDPDIPTLGHITRQNRQERDTWVTASVQTYDAIVEKSIWHQVQALVAANTRSNARSRHSPQDRAGVRQSEPSRGTRWPASWSATLAAGSSKATGPGPRLLPLQAEQGLPGIAG